MLEAYKWSNTAATHDEPTPLLPSKNTAPAEDSKQSRKRAADLFEGDGEPKEPAERKAEKTAKKAKLATLDTLKSAQNLAKGDKPTSAAKKQKASEKDKDRAEATSKAKSKKRKAKDVETVKSDAEPTPSQSSNKKQKKTTSALESVTNKLSKVVGAAVSSVNGLVGSAEKSVMDDVTEVAEAVVQERHEVTAKEKKKSNAKAKTKGKVPSQVQEDSSEDDVSNPNERDHGDEDIEEDDQTAALLKGFESDEDSDDMSDEGGYKEGQPIPKIPKATEVRKQLKQATSEEEDESGIIYVG